MKECKYCKTMKNYEEFSKNKNRKDGYQYYCKPCSSRLTMKTRDADNYQAYQETHREHSHLTSIRARAKEKGLDFNLTLDDFVIPDVCPVLDIPLKRNFGKGFSSHNSPSLDRIVPSKGYVKGNVIIISTLANRIKQDATPEQIMKVGKFFAKTTVS